MTDPWWTVAAVAGVILVAIILVTLAIGLWQEWTRRVDRQRKPDGRGSHGHRDT